MKPNKSESKFRTLKNGTKYVVSCKSRIIGDSDKTLQNMFGQQLALIINELLKSGDLK